MLFVFVIEQVHSQNNLQFNPTRTVSSVREMMDMGRFFDGGEDTTGNNLSEGTTRPLKRINAVKGYIVIKEEDV